MTLSRQLVAKRSAQSATVRGARSDTRNRCRAGVNYRHQIDVGKTCGIDDEQPLSAGHRSDVWCSWVCRRVTDVVGIWESCARCQLL